MMEHGILLAALLPTDDLAGLRAQAVGFAESFANYLNQLPAMPFDESNYRTVNQRTIDMVVPFIDFKHTIHEMQDTGQIHSFVYPSLALEAAEEAEHFVAILHQLSDGMAQRNLYAEVPFWLTMMADHALLAETMLDPQEMELKQQTMDMAMRIKAMRDLGQPDIPQIAAELDAIIAFKDHARNMIEAGAVDSIIHPAVMDHMRREAVKARDELHFFTGV